ncbi:YqgE/AlgH family protein [Oleiagrimonas sp. C23AA]|uniref:YqgE/AlgH family protein n=1 Tax=Oleiagrimonas sp. C23AA TaxID=2719047 RepID=UPI00141E6A8B|nr:YqgE/AlgH family protein [Oleiagrimonas sp. C23AA]NII11993.1 YqgE/AlgH family protein [Oleiagrimonas sp. C23AA]
MAAMNSPISLAGQFLIAMPAMDDPDFARGVTFVCQHNDEGAIGLVVNRLSEFRLGDVLAQMKLSCDDEAITDAPVLLGGPVQPERGFVLHQSRHHFDSSYQISERWAVTTSRDILSAMAAGEGPERAVVALGYAGWGAGQLENELKENAWLTTPADEHIVFDTPLEDRWSAATRLVGIDPSHLTGYAGHA